MLPKIVLVAGQASTALFLGPFIVRSFSLGGSLNYFLYGIVFSLVIWSVGQFGTEVLKNTPRPTSSTLTTAFIGGLIGGAIVVFFPFLITPLAKLLTISTSQLKLYFPLIGAISGYFVQKQ